MAVPLPDPDADRDHHSCAFCDAHVTADFRRSYGDDARRAHRCPECDSWARIMRGSAAGKEVDHPDPQVASNRNGGKELRGKAVADGGGNA